MTYEPMMRWQRYLIWAFLGTALASAFLVGLRPFLELISGV